MKEFVWLIDCVCVWVKQTQTSPIPPAKLGEPILLGFCTTTQLRDVGLIIYSGQRLNIFIHFVFTGGSNFPFFHILWSRLITLRIALPCICVMKTWLADVICFDICLLRDFSCNVILRIVVVFFVRTHTVFISFLKGLCLVSYQNLMHCLVAGNHILLFCKLVESHFKVL